MSEEDIKNSSEEHLQDNDNIERKETSSTHIRKRIPQAEKVIRQEHFTERGPRKSYGRNNGFYGRRNDTRSLESYFESKQSLQRPDRSFYNNRGNESLRYSSEDRYGRRAQEPLSRPYAEDRDVYRSERRYDHYNSSRFSSEDTRSDYSRYGYSEGDTYERNHYADGFDNGSGDYRKPYRPNRDSDLQRRGYANNKPVRKKPKQPKKSLNETPKEVVRYKDETIDPNQPIRLNKYLANSGICSRRDADAFILAGMVRVNNVAVKELGTKVLRTDVVKFKDKVVTMGDKVYVLLNKPKNCVTTSEDPQNRKTVLDIVKNACPERIYPVGRLDRNTTGVLLLTNDGDLASQLTHPKFLKKKIYHVFLDKEIDEETMAKIRTGIELEDGEIKADAIEYAKDDDKTQVGIEIHSGRNRIVRRIFESLGFHVVKLDRVYFAGLTKKNLKRGQWRYLTAEEVNMLKMGAFE